MTAQISLASLLDSHMNSASIGDARLANQVNSINGNSYFIHRSTIRNWRTGSAKKANRWQQLATVAVALGLDAVETDALLKSAGCLPIKTLAATANEADRALLAHWQSSNPLTTPNDHISTPEKSGQTVELEPHESESQTGSESERKSVLHGMKKPLGLFIAGCIAAAIGYLSIGYFQSLAKNKNLLTNSQFSEGTVGWTSYVHNSSAARFNVENGFMHIFIDQAGRKGWHISINQKNLSVEAGRTYLASFRVRGDGATSFRVDITRVNDPKTSISFENSVRQTITTTEDWALQTLAFEAIETVTADDGGARLFFQFGTSTEGWLMLDDIELMEQENATDL